MRKSKSLLTNISNPQGRHPEGYSGYEAHDAVRPHADAIQQRIDQYRPQNVYSPQQMPPQDYRQQPMYSDAHYPAPNPHYPPHIPVPPQQHSGGYSAPNHQLDSVRANLEKLTAKLGMVAQAQESRTRGTANQDALRKQVDGIAGAIIDLKSVLSGMQSNLVQPAEIEFLQDTINKNYNDIVARLDIVGKTEIDPSAYAQAVEASHADVIEQIRQIQASLQSNAALPADFAKSVETSYADLAGKIGELGNKFSLSEADDIAQIKQQLSGLEHALTAIATREAEPSTENFSGFEKQLEEVNRALVAMASIDNGTDSLDRIEARIKEVARDLGALSEKETPQLPSFDTATIETQLSDVSVVLDEINTRLEQSASGGTHGFDDLTEEMKILGRKIESLEAASVAPDAGPAPMVDLSAVENRFVETSDVIRELETRIMESFGSKDPDISELQSEVQRLGDKIDNFTAASFSGGGEEIGSSALLERLDALAARENPKPAEIDLSSIENRFDETRLALQELESRILAQSTNAVPDMSEFSSQFQAVSEKVDYISSIAAQSDGEQASDPILLERVDQLVQKVEQLGGLQGTEGSGSSPELLMSLQEQMALLSEQIGNQSGESSGLAAVTESLGNIQQQLGASRDIGIEMAAGAAEEAVRKVLEELPAGQTGIDPSVISALHQDIQSLQGSIKPGAESDVPFRELQDTLAAIAERLHSLENGIHEIRTQGSNAGVLPAVAPSLDITTEPAPAVITPDNTEPARLVEQVETPATAVVETGTVPDAEPVLVQEQDVASPADQVRLEDTASASEEELFESEFDDSKMSAGERLVKAARRAEQERQRAKQEYQEEFAATPATPDYSDSLAAHAHSLAEEQRAAAHELPEVPAPDLAPAQMPETLDVQNGFETGESEVEEDAPIEPGASGPDLAALVKQANERRKTLANREDGTSGTDFLAAARKAAQAAALEASVVEAEAEKAKPQKSKSLLGSLPSLITKRKKAIVIAAAAALLVAIAVPIVTKFVFSPDVKEVASIEATAHSESEAIASVEEFDPSQDRIAVVTELDTDEAENAFPVVESEIEQVGDSAFNVSEEQTAAIPSSQPLPFDVTEIGFASDALKAAVEQNDAAAVFEVGRRYTNGIGTEKNLQEAAKWYEHAASLGYVPAQYIIGNFNEKGVGLEADRTMAEAWYEQAAESGHLVAMHNLAVMNASPDPSTGKANLEKSFKWFSKAAEHGVRDSQVNMGILLAKGVGTDVDLIESYKWLALAAKSGDADAEQKRDFIGDAMRPDQLEEARTRLANWKQLEPDPTANTIIVPDSWKSADDKLAVLTDQNTISQAQTLLTKLGFDAGPADGVMGKKTREAIAAFRARSGLAVSDRLDIEFMETLRAVSI